MVKPLWCRVLEASSSSSRTVGPGVDTQGYRPYWTNTRTLTLESARCTVTAQLWWGNVRCCFSKILLNLHACLISTAWMHVFIYPVHRVDWWRVSLPEVLVLSRDFNVHRRLFVFFLPTSKTSTRPRTSSIVWQSDCGVQQTLLMSLLPCFIYSDASNRLLDAGMNVLGFFFFTGCTEWATEHVKRSTKNAQRSNGIVQVYMKLLWWRVVVFNLYLNIFFSA